LEVWSSEVLHERFDGVQNCRSWVDQIFTQLLQKVEVWPLFMDGKGS
jgi:hypothetical protein